MAKWVTAALLQLIRLLVDKQVLEEIQVLVMAQWFSDLSGPEKKAQVTEALKNLKGELGEIVGDLSGWLISTAIDLVHAYLVTRTED